MKDPGCRLILGAIRLHQRRQVPTAYSVKADLRSEKHETVATTSSPRPFHLPRMARLKSGDRPVYQARSQSKYDELLGVHIIGPKATELIAERS